MVWDQTGSTSKRGYHHGNLREALLASALELIKQKGVGGFTVADLARAADVSPAAPYRHYRDRDELISDLARIGFERFGADLLAAWDHAKPNPRTALIRVGRAYLQFARENPALYACMFESGVPIAARPDLNEVADAAFLVLRMACDAVIAEFPTETRPPALMVALHIWSLAHGIAGLFGTGNKGGRVVPMSPEDLLEAGVLVYLDGFTSPSKR